jgi:TatD DNase family protein
MTHTLIDTHAHLYYEAKFAHEVPAALARALAAGVGRIYLPNVDLDSIGPMLALEAAHPDYCVATMGLHPCSVGADFEAVLAQMATYLPQRKFAAIGEMGTDLYWDKTFFAQQQEAFRTQAGWAKQYGLPLIIHSRESQPHTIALLRELHDERLYGVQHCFVGPPAEAHALTELGFMLGIGGVVTYKNATDLHQTVREVPLEHLVLETDSPYLAPMPHRGKRGNEPAYLPLVAERVAELKGISVAEVAEATSANARRMFQL